MQRKHFEPINLAAGLLLAATALMNSIAGFFLPQTLTGVVSPYRVTTLSFLAGGILLVGICGIMAVFGPKPKKWIALEAVLTVLDGALVIYQLVLQ